MAIEGLNSILRAQSAQRSHFSQPPKEQNKDAEEGLKLLFDYIKASNEQMLGLCSTILNNQKVMDAELHEIKEVVDRLEGKNESL